jgi:hypothetical protein
VFDKYHVDVVINGHDHEYERSLPLVAGSPPSGAPVVKQTPADGTVYFVNAGAGADPYKVASYTSDYRDGDPIQLGSLSPKGYIGCYALMVLDGKKMTITGYGMKPSSTGVAGDDVINTFTLGQ